MNKHVLVQKFSSQPPFVASSGHPTFQNFSIPACSMLLDVVIERSTILKLNIKQIDEMLYQVVLISENPEISARLFLA